MKKAKPDMMARAMAKAQHEDTMLAGTDPMVTACRPFQVPAFILPDPIEIKLSLCAQVDAILQA